ncbi:MAG: PilN domain-containing protein [Acidobacteriota bacterium]
MIKINLLSEGRKPVAARKGSRLEPGPSQREWAPIVLGLVVVAAILAFALWWWGLHSEIKENDQALARARAKVAELEEIIQEVEQYKARQAELEHKIAVIKDLRRNQQGPVQVMDAISTALPELLWLDNLSMNNRSVTLTGRAFNPNAVANFIENLDRVPAFQEPILRNTQQVGNVYNFTVVFNYSYLRPAEDSEDGESTAVAAGG